MKYFLLFVCFITSCLIGQAQNNRTLVTIDGTPYSTEEFQRLFNKNANLIEDDTADIGQKIELFTNYHLKINEAKKQGLDTLPAFVEQVRRYQSQISKQYLTDFETKEKLVQEAYHRLKYERNVNYIMVLLPKNGKDGDTLQSYEKALEFKTRMDKGEKFEDLAETYTEDPNYVKNKGNLGWVKAFKTIYPFENIVYQAPVGKAFGPFRSGLSFYVIQVKQEREVSGLLSVSQILLKTDQTAPSSNVEKQANQIYGELENGKDFEELVKKYSQDKKSAARLGKLPAFYKGAHPDSQFDEIAFALSEKNPISKPFQTAEGWHILKFNSIEHLGTYEEEKEKIEQKIEKNMRAQVIKDSELAKLKKQYKIIENPKALSYFEPLLAENPEENLQRPMPKENLLQIEGETISYQSFADWILPQAKLRPEGIPTELLKKYLKVFTDREIYDYAQGQLYQTQPEYAHKLDDYSNGMLIYDLMSKNVWNKEVDSTEWQKFYQKINSDKNRISQKEPLVSEGEVQSLWQVHKEKEFIDSLRSGSTIEINQKELENLKK